MNPLELVKLTAVMERTSGRPEIRIGLIDGPVVLDHPDLAGENIREVPGGLPARCTQASTAACLHGTFVAGILCGRRTSVAPAICPGCTLLMRPIFSEKVSNPDSMPSALPEELAVAMLESMDAGAQILNLSVALVGGSSHGLRQLEDALNLAVRRGVLVVAAAGNQGTLGSSCLTRHPWVVPVVACDNNGRPTGESNLGVSIGRRGLCAPGRAVTSLGARGQPETFTGTSAAAPFVTGTIALLWSEFPRASPVAVRAATAGAALGRPNSVVPPLLDAWGAYQTLAAGL